MRADLEIIQEWIPANSRVLDLGCGDGELLSWLQKNKNVTFTTLILNNFILKFTDMHRKIKRKLLSIAIITLLAIGIGATSCSEEGGYEGAKPIVSVDTSKPVIISE